MHYLAEGELDLLLGLGLPFGFGGLGRLLVFDAE